MPRSYLGSTPEVDPRSLGVIPRRFKRKKDFVTEGHRTPDRRDSRNSYVDFLEFTNIDRDFFKKVLGEI